MIFGGLEKFTLIDYPGKIACMIYTIGCNFRCPYCHNPELVDETVEKTFSEEYFFDFLIKRKEMLEGVVITGGEPTLHRDLIKVIRKIKKLGFLVKLDSNGTNPKVLRYLIKTNLVDYVAMDIKAPLYKYHETVARPVDINSIKESISLLISSDIKYEFRTTIIRSMISENDIIQIGKEIEGAESYYLQKFVPTKLLNPQFKKKVSYSDEELKKFQNLLNNYVKHCEIR